MKYEYLFWRENAVASIAFAVTSFMVGGIVLGWFEIPAGFGYVFFAVALVMAVSGVMAMLFWIEVAARGECPYGRHTAPPADDADR